jgi:hypothetical protein
MSALTGLQALRTRHVPHDDVRADRVDGNAAAGRNADVEIRIVDVVTLLRQHDLDARDAASST